MTTQNDRDRLECISTLEVALRRVLEDPDLRRDFWRAGYEQLSEHASQGAARWIGSRLMSSIGGALIAFLVWIAYRFGT